MDEMATGYVQVRVDHRTLVRSREIDPAGRSNGYPAYRADVNGNFTSVLSILYNDDSGIYLTDDKVFKLVSINNTWYFSADPTLPSYRYPEFQYIPWNSTWANQKNTGPDYNELVVPVYDVDEALSRASSERIPISFYRDVSRNRGKNFPFVDSGAWIVSVDSSSTPGGVAIFFNWWDATENKKSAFWLEKRPGTNSWLFRLVGVKGFNNYPLRHCDIGHTDDNPYVGVWEEYNAYRWMTTFDEGYWANNDIARVEGYTYQLTMNGRRLNQGGQYLQLGFICVPYYRVGNPVEYFNDNGNDIMNIDFAVLPNPDVHYTPSDRDRYVYDGYLRFMVNMHEDYGPYNPANIAANQPKPGGYDCSGLTWDGAQISCWDTPQVPYTTSLGYKECDLEGIVVDPHCQDWAKANRGDSFSQYMKNACVNATYNNPPVCNCFLPDQEYYNRIETNLSKGVADTLLATQGLQCESGICPSDSSLSSQLFYFGGRTCSYCINILKLTLTAKEVKANINVIQECAGADVTYTWDQVIRRLIDMGAYYDGKGLTKDVMIASDKESIILNTLSVKGKDALSQLSLLSTITQKDSIGRLVLTRAQWNSNISGYTRDLTLFLILVKSK